jgi:hypothetical protein
MDSVNGADLDAHRDPRHESYAQTVYEANVLVDGTPDVRRLAGRMRWALLDMPASFDILVRPVDWWAQVSATPYSLERRIEEEGVELHAAAG